jgi:hypothetical protein
MGSVGTPRWTPRVAPARFRGIPSAVLKLQRYAMPTNANDLTPLYYNTYRPFCTKNPNWLSTWRGASIRNQ